MIFCVVKMEIYYKMLYNMISSNRCFYSRYAGQRVTYMVELLPRFEISLDFTSDASLARYEIICRPTK